MDSIAHHAQQLRPEQSEIYSDQPPQRARDVVRDALNVETARRRQAVRWDVPAPGDANDRMLDYQRAKPSSTPDAVMGSMRQHLFFGMGLLEARDAVRLMNALERAQVVSRSPRRLINPDGINAVLGSFRRGGIFGKVLSAAKKDRLRALLLDFDRIAKRRAAIMQASSQYRFALSETLDARLNPLEPHGHALRWYRERILEDGSVQQAQDAYVRCMELLYTHPSKLFTTP